ncbi:DUF4340 domain-containing protein [Celerinatantimonas yamalensis]|uniref:DUF4340 domain-containing protein n=1 Tax=Celerinatantimonas yamalensis TaxID=559956 RepID=A0ABW9G4G2_9GAMM
MFKKLTLGLSGLFAAQIALSAGVFYHEHVQASQQVAKTLFSFEPSQIDHIAISSHDNKVLLRKVHQHWVLPGLDQLPADSARVEQLLSQLTTARVNWPIADSKSAQQRFKVAPKDFKTHVSMHSAKHTLANFYIGDSPTFHQVSVRKKGQRAIYQLNLLTGPLMANSASWLDKMLLATPNQQISGNNFDIKKNQQIWQWQGKAHSKQRVLSQNKATLLSESLANLNIEHVAVTPLLGKPQFSLHVQSGQHHYRYQFWHKDNRYQVERSDYNVRFAINQGQYQQLAKVNELYLLDKVKQTASKSVNHSTQTVKPTPTRSSESELPAHHAK